MTQHLKMVGMVVGMLVVAAVVASCGASGAAGANAAPQLAPIADMPQQVQQASVVVREAYQFAVANPDVMQQVPCYCGCGAMGHTSNYSCYVQGTDADGTVHFDSHALGCTLCVDITHDTMRMSGQGKSVAEIRAYVDQQYSRFGPPTP